MLFLADENFPIASVQLLRHAAHHVRAIVEFMSGATDREVLALAVREHRIILTFDRDYGELIYRVRLPSPPGVIYLRYAPLSPEEPGQHILNMLVRSSFTLIGKFTVAERTSVRQRPLLVL